MVYLKCPPACSPLILALHLTQRGGKYATRLPWGLGSSRSSLSPKLSASPKGTVVWESALGVCSSHVCTRSPHPWLPHTAFAFSSRPITRAREPP